MDRIERLQVFLAASPEDSFVKHALALEYVKLGEDEKARSLFEAILIHEADYIGSYYHLAKLLERIGCIDEAIKVYEDGMKRAAAKADNHALSELRSAYEELTF